MADQIKIADLVLPKPQVEQSLSKQNTNKGLDDSFHNYLEQSSNEVNQPREPSSEQNNRQKEADPQQTNTKGPKTPQNGDGSQPEDGLTTGERKTNFIPEAQTKEITKVFGHDHKSFAASLANTIKTDAKSANTGINVANELSTSKDLISEKLQEIGLDLEAIEKLLNIFNSDNLTVDESSLDLIQTSTLLPVPASLESPGSLTETDLLGQKQEAVNLLRQSGIKDKRALNLINQLHQIYTVANKLERNTNNLNHQPTGVSTETEKPAEIVTRPDGLFKVKEKAEIVTRPDGLFKVKEKAEIVTRPDGLFKVKEKKVDVTNDFGVTSKESPKKSQKTQKEVRHLKLTRGAKILIPDGVENHRQPVQTQQNISAESRIKGLEPNLQNSQDAFSIFNQSLAKVSAEVIPQNLTKVPVEVIPKNLTKVPVEAIPQNPLQSKELLTSDLNDLNLDKTKLPKGISERSIVNQVIQKFTIRTSENNNEIKMRLEPPSLGTVRMNVITQGDAVKTTIVAENQAVKQIIENNLSQLKDSFSGQGLKVESFEVMVGGEPGFKEQKQHQQKLGTGYLSKSVVKESTGLQAIETSSLRAAMPGKSRGFSAVA